jgi:membrane-anchored glycerophosphoryl diester phosphodiesterase (GDPDase)
MYVVRTITIVAFSGYVHARLVLYLPTAAYSTQPESWRESWKRTRAHGARLFTLFFIIGFVPSAVQLGIVMLSYRAPGYFDAVDFISGLLGVRSNYILRNLGQELAYVILGLPGTLLEAAASLVAFKTLMPASDSSTADIFN